MLQKITFPYTTTTTIFIAVITLMILLIIDTTFIKSYDLFNKTGNIREIKKIIFSVSVFVCLLLQYIILRLAQNFVTDTRLKQKINLKKSTNIIKLAFLLILCQLFFLNYRLFFLNYYNSIVLILIISTTYGISAILLGKVASLFISWFRINRDFATLLYSISIVLLLVNFILTATTVDLSLISRPEQIRQFAGGSMDISGGKYSLLLSMHKVSTILSFISIWITTSLLIHSSKDKILKKIKLWIFPSALLVYFFISYFSQEIFGQIISSVLREDPIMISFGLIMIFTLIKPIGGAMFGLSFWNISRTVSYEKTLKDYMIIAGYGFLFLFSANQSTSLVLGPYPPFGVSPILMLIIGSYLVLIGIYSSALSLSNNIQLRKLITNLAKESKLLDSIGLAEVQKEKRQIVNKIINGPKELGESESTCQIDENQLKIYLDKVVRELSKRKENK